MNSAEPLYGTQTVLITVCFLHTMTITSRVEGVPNVDCTLFIYSNYKFHKTLSIGTINRDQ